MPRREYNSIQRSFRRPKQNTWDDLIARWLTANDVDYLEVVNTLTEAEMLPDSMQCPRCQNRLRRWRARNNSLVFMWYCRHKKPKKSETCKFTASLRTGTIFACCKLSIPEQLSVINGWLKNESVRDISRRLNIGNFRTVPRLFKKCRDVSLALVMALAEPIGGPGKVVEIDESLFGKRKYNKGKFKRSVWVFGGVERGSNKCFLVPVVRRNKETLLALIKQWILPETTIISDEWRAYRDIPNLPDQGYTHHTVNHSVAYVNPLNQAHTNTIEGMWGLVKRGLSRGGRRPEHLEAYFAKFMLLRMVEEPQQLLPEFVKMANSVISIGVQDEIVAEVLHWRNLHNDPAFADSVDSIGEDLIDDDSGDDGNDDDNNDAPGDWLFDFTNESAETSVSLAPAYQAHFESFESDQDNSLYACHMLQGNRLLLVRRQSCDNGTSDRSLPKRQRKLPSHLCDYSLDLPACFNHD